ncbi:GntR family transcriptional regulator [Paenibacillus sp. 453mf]|uniref:GntR family transcriptional regulator n=1 Tax=Paenibacillus sp. 453mf TaxID=1761874 RepID=UPI0008DF7E59|nr:GntR family transcriptional regulator [Paenibacillus sp. 453mf]SFS37029.1 GntR family transcriptional regulator [Paenibacillus sp. 453mf]
MFELDVRSRKPIYEQLVERIKELIMLEMLQPDEQLPSVRHLSAELTVNPNTIQKAYRELERDGYIYSLPGKGSFVAKVEHRPVDQRKQELRLEIHKLFTEAIYLGLTEDEIQGIYQKAQQDRLSDSGKGEEKHD